MDNLPAHKVTGMRQTIESSGAKLFYLPLILLISIQSNLPFQNLRACCAKPLHALCAPYGKPIGNSWIKINQFIALR